MIAKPTSPAFFVPAFLSLTMLANVEACSSNTGTNATNGADAKTDGGKSSGGGTSEPGSDSGVPTSSGDDAAAAASPQATFRTIDTSQYLTSDATGALAATSAAGGDPESFTLTDVNGGALNDGDTLYIADTNGHYLSALGGGGGALTFSAKTPGDDETFVLVRVDAPGPIAVGDHVALQTKVTGNYVSAINGGGGQVLANAPWDHAWETFTFDLKTSPPIGTIDGGTDSGPTALSARQKVLDFLAGISGKQTLIGLEDKDSSNPEADTNKMAGLSGNGQAPSFWSGDFGFGSAAQPSSRESIVTEGKKKWSQGAIVQYIYHACPLGWGSNEGCDYQDGSNPIKGSYGQLSDQQWADLTTPGGTLNKVWLARLDVLSPYFQELKDAGVAPLFRPLHEINASKSNNGGWAWWQGRPGLTGSARLYQITHDYLVKTKGFENIIWVWNVQDYSSLASDVNDYNPGAAYFDIAGLDVYNTGYTQGNYNAMLAGAGGKPIGIAECQFLPSADVLSKQPLWTYAAMWPDFFTENASLIPALFSDPQVIPLSKMPGW